MHDGIMAYTNQDAVLRLCAWPLESHQIVYIPRDSEAYTALGLISPRFSTVRENVLTH